MIRIIAAASLSFFLYLQTTNAKFADFAALHIQNTTKAIANDDAEYFTDAADKAIQTALTAAELVSAKWMREQKENRMILAKMQANAPEFKPVRPDPAPKATAKPAPVATQKTASQSHGIHKLGKLSEKYESNGKPWVIGYDSTGGHSYGSYQIATYTGTFKRFMRWLKANHPSYYRQLSAAGGNRAATKGTRAFKAKWRKLGRQKGFAMAQHQFIADTHYIILARRLKRIGINLSSRSHALKDVAWSVAVQHGSRTNIFNRCRRHKASDKALIDCVYSIRGNYFKRSTAAVKRSVRNRFKTEHRNALAMLRRERG